MNFVALSRQFAIALLVSFTASMNFAAEAKAPANKNAAPAPVKDQGQDGVVRVDGAAVYEVQNFDAPVKEYLDSGKVYKISKKVYPGIGGLGSFYKIRLRQGVFGFIADTDIAPRKKGAESESEPRPKAATTEEVLPKEMAIGRDDEGENDDDGAVKSELYIRRYFGLGYSSLNYAEQISNNVKNATTPLFAIKLTGPTKFLGGNPLDISFLLTTSAPSFYQKIASSTSGAMLIADILPFYPLSDAKNYLFYYGVGLMGRYSRWSVNLRNQPSAPAIDSEELALGLEGALGLAVLVQPKVAVRADARYYYEKQKYFGMGAAVEFRY